jgi:DNA-directed RNA polymerase specialized sigma24 family protein
MGRESEVSDDDALFAAIYPGLRRWAAVCGPAEVDPDDLVQEAVARTLRTHALSDLDDAGAYLRRAIVNLAANHRRAGGARCRACRGRPR